MVSPTCKTTAALAWVDQQLAQGRTVVFIGDAKLGASPWADQVQPLAGLIDPPADE